MGHKSKTISSAGSARCEEQFARRAGGVDDRAQVADARVTSGRRRELWPVTHGDWPAGGEITVQDWPRRH
jgi:hypothetical protein